MSILMNALGILVWVIIAILVLALIFGIVFLRTFVKEYAKAEVEQAKRTKKFEQTQKKILDNWGKISKDKLNELERGK